MLNDEYKLLASVSVFRELYDSNKNIYDVLERFIAEIIIRKKLYSFSAADMANLLTVEYGFKINESVVKTTLKHMHIERSYGQFKVKDISKFETGVEQIIRESKEKQKIIFDLLCEFANTKTGLKLGEKDELINCFCDFLMQDSVGASDEHNQLFNEFILSFEGDKEKLEILSTIKEGTLIYEGIKYSGNVSETGSWKTKLNLILDTEILFAIGGYNSEMYQELFSEMYKYIKEINSSGKQREEKINMFYLPETMQEIDDYFFSAERIVSGLDFLDPTKEAMGQIVNNCCTKSDVQQKKALFLHKLREYNIKSIDYDFYEEDNENNYTFNLEDEKIIEKYNKLWNDNKDNKESIFKSLRMLSHTNVLRCGESNHGFENCRYILLTQTGRTLKLARTKELINEGEVPLATTFDFLINRFWFKLNKGFGGDRTPRTVDMVVRARHVLSSIISNTAAVKYDEFKRQYENNDITKEQFCYLNNDLRSKLRTPDEINVDTIGDEIESIDKWDMNSVIEEQKKRECQLSSAKSKIESLTNIVEKEKEKNEKLEQRIQSLESEFITSKEKHQEEFIQLNSEYNAEKERNQEELESLKEKLQALEKEKQEREDKQFERQKRNKNIRIVFLIICIVCFSVIYVIGTVKGLAWANIVCGVCAIFPAIELIIYLGKKIR